MQKINYKSDFDFIVTMQGYDDSGNAIDLGFPEYDWRLRLTTKSNCSTSRSFIASYLNGVATNCFNDDNKIHIVCNNHGLGVGKLIVESLSYIPNDIYADSIQSIVLHQETDIELVLEGETTDQTMQIALQMPVIAISGSGGGADLTKYLLKTDAEKTYAKKTDIPEIPTVPKNVSELINDANYTTLNEVGKSYQPKGDYATEQALAEKQDKLIEGDGISIVGNTISCTHDKTLYKIVTALPDVGDEQKIYLIVSTEQEESNIYNEWAYINSKWEMLGTYKAKIDLEPYALKTEIPTLTSQLVNDSNFARIEDIPPTETYVLNFTIKDGVNTGTYDATEYANLRAAIENGKLIIIGGAVTRVTADSQAMAADYVVIRYSTPRISEDNKTVTISFYELKFSASEYTSKAIHKTIG